MTALGTIVIAIAFAIVVLAYYLAIKNTLRPGEDAPDHIQRRILDDEQAPEIRKHP